MQQYRGNQEEKTTVFCGTIRLLVHSYSFFIMFLAVIFLLPAILLMPFVRRFREGFFNYFGFVSPSLPDKPSSLIHIHCVSVGELKLGLSLAAELSSLNPSLFFYFTTTTPEAVDFFNRSKVSFPAATGYFPLDSYLFTLNFLSRLKPLKIIVMEVDFWPAFLMAATDRNIPVYLVNARFSPRAITFMGKILPEKLSRTILNSFEYTFVQSGRDLVSFVSLGGDSSRCAFFGNMKFDLLCEKNMDEIKLARLKKNLFERVLVFGSTHPEEERIILEALKMLEPELLKATSLIIAPRKSSRARETAKLFSSLSPVLFLTEILERPPEKFSPASLVVVDTMGDLAMLYSIATLAYVGGGFDGMGGHNVLEPLQAGVPVIYGKDMRNFADICQELENRNAGIRITSAGELAENILKLSKDQGFRKNLVENARLIIAENSGVTKKIAFHILDS